MRYYLNLLRKAEYSNQHKNNKQNYKSSLHAPWGYLTRNSESDLASNLSPNEVQTKSSTSFSDKDFEKFPV
jgi:hypothetical protein